jgi:hypothetical protein
VYLIGPSGPTAPELDASGQDVFFQSESELVPQDSDSQFDVYDAHVDGGFPAPVEPATCSGEACQGAPSPAPLFTASSTTSPIANSNLKPPTAVVPTPKVKPKPKPVVCKKGFTKKRNKCVKAKKKAKKPSRRGKS